MLDFHARAEAAEARCGCAQCRTTEALGRLRDELDDARGRNAGLLARNGALIEERARLERQLARVDAGRRLFPVLLEGSDGEEWHTVPSLVAEINRLRLAAAS